MKHAPIVIFTYNRLHELKFTIESLQKNNLASDSNVVIYSDAAKNEKDFQKVHLVREYLKTIKGFKEIKIIHRPTNYGLARSVIEGVTEVLNISKKIIVLEDDIITSKNFLQYMNSALNFYEDDENIFSISAFTMSLKSLKRYDKDTYIALRPASWGWGTWKNQWEDIDWDVKDYESFISNNKSIHDFNKGGIDLTKMLKAYMEKRNNSWAIRWSYAMFKAKKYSIYPKISKVQNIGFSDDATHCTNDHIYKTDLDDGKQSTFNFTSNLSLQEDITKDFKNVYEYHNKLFRKIKIKLSNYLLIYKERNK